MITTFRKDQFLALVGTLRDLPDPAHLLIVHLQINIDNSRIQPV